MAAPAPLPTATVAATDLRLTLERLLGRHALVLARATAARAAGRPVPTGIDGEDGALAVTSDGLAGTVALVWGAEAGLAWRQVWRTRTASALQHAGALHAGQQAQVRATAQALAEADRDLAAFLAHVTGNGAPGDGVVVLPLLQRASHATVAATGDDSGTDATRRALQAQAAMAAVAEALADAAAAQPGDRVPAAGAEGRRTAALRSTLGLVLAAHADRTGAALALVVARDEAAPNAVTALEPISDALAAAVRPSLGEGGARTVAVSWRNHVGLLVGYAEARTRGDAADADRLRARLDAFPLRLADDLAKATGGALPAGAVTQQMPGLTADLLDGVDAAAAGDAVDAALAAERADGQAHDVAALLAGGIEAVRMR